MKTVPLEGQQVASHSAEAKKTKGGEGLARVLFLKTCDRGTLSVSHSKYSCPSGNPREASARRGVLVVIPTRLIAQISPQPINNSQLEAG